MASDNEKLWVERYIETGDAKGATAELFNCSDKNLSARTSQLKAKLASDIDKRLRETMRTNSVTYHQVLSNLAMSAKSEQVRAKAAQDLLDRGGYKPVDQHEDLTEPLTHEQIEQQYQQALASLAPADLRQALEGMTEEDRQALLESITSGLDS